MMPGKVNPTQAEAMMMVCIQIMGADVAVQMAGAEGNFELNAFRPVVIYNFLNSARLMSDACRQFAEHLVEGTTLNRAQLQKNIDQSLMMVTALAPSIGYDKDAEIAHDAVKHGLTLREAALAHGVSETLYDSVVVPRNLTHS